MRSFSGSVSKTWNSINPATLSGAIDVVVVEQEDGKEVESFCTQDSTHACRIALLLPLSCSVWEILITKTIREKGKAAFDRYLTLPLLLYIADSHLGRVQGQ